MEIPALPSLPIHLQLQPHLQSLPTTDQPAAASDLQKVSREFEAVLLRQFVGEALKPLLHQTPGSNAPGAQIYQYMITDAIANNLAQHELFGLSSLLQMQLAAPVGQDGAQSPEGSPATVTQLPLLP